jgi:hypothetical protein
MTPEPLARKIVGSLRLDSTSKILEPSFGKGAFLIACIDKLLEYGQGNRAEKLIGF